MHILSKLDYARFSFSNLFFLKLSKKTLGVGSTPVPLGKGGGVKAPSTRIGFHKKKRNNCLDRNIISYRFHSDFSHLHENDKNCLKR